jgi:DNA-directed RNA polymerase subunit RPC12/RpoP
MDLSGVRVVTSPAVCEDCGRAFDADQLGTWRSIAGWAVNRNGGGANRRDLQETGRYVCPDCGRLRDLGVPPGQESLL